MRTRWRTRRGWYNDMNVVEFAVDGYRLIACPDKPPALLAEYRSHAQLSEKFGLDTIDVNSAYCFFALAHAGQDWPTLVVEQRYSPSGFG